MTTDHPTPTLTARINTVLAIMLACTTLTLLVLGGASL